jgi:FMN phosphatase YigB (HAD superfamily)
MKVVAIDLDNTLFLNKALFEKVFEKHGMNYYPSKHWDMRDYPEEIRKEIFELFNKKEFVNQPLIEKDIGKLLNETNKVFDVKFVSAREEELFLETAKRLMVEFPEFFTLDKLLFSSSRKSDILKTMDLETHFDDSPEVIEDLKKNDLNFIMISNNNTPYNHKLRKDTSYIEKLSDGLIWLLNKQR